MELLLDTQKIRSLCEFSQTLHPASEKILENFISGALNQADFLRLFSLPNSEYISYASCFVKALSSASGIMVQ